MEVVQSPRGQAGQRMHARRSLNAAGSAETQTLPVPARVTHLLLRGPAPHERVAVVATVSNMHVVVIVSLEVHLGKKAEVGEAADLPDEDTIIALAELLCLLCLAAAQGSNLAARPLFADRTTGHGCGPLRWRPRASFEQGARVH